MKTKAKISSQTKFCLQKSLEIVLMSNNLNGHEELRRSEFLITIEDT